MKNIADLSEILLALGLSSSVTELQRAIAQEALRMSHAAVRRFLKYDPVQAERTEYYPQMDLGMTGRQEVWEVTDTTAYSRRLSQATTDELQVQHIPIRSISSLKIDYDGRSGTRSGSFGASTAKTQGTDFWPNFDGVDSTGARFCRDGIIRAEGRWPDKAGSVQIVYTAGYTDAELHGEDTVLDASPILDAVIDEAVRRVHKAYSRMKRPAGFLGPLTSENLGDYSYSVDTSVSSKLVGVGTDVLPETEHKLQDFLRLDLGVM